MLDKVESKLFKVSSIGPGPAGIKVKDIIDSEES